MKTIFNPAYKNLVNGLRAERIDQGLRQEDAAKKMGVSRHWIHKVETCQTRLDIVQFVRLCQVYGFKSSPLIQRMEKELSDEDASFYLLVRMTEASQGCIAFINYEEYYATNNPHFLVVIFRTCGHFSCINHHRQVKQVSFNTMFES